MTLRTTTAMSPIFRFGRFGPIVFASAVLLSPLVHAAPQSAGTQGQAQSSDKQGGDQAGPPTLRHKDDAVPNPSKAPTQPGGQPASGAPAESNQPVTPPPDNARAPNQKSEKRQTSY